MINADVAKKQKACQEDLAKAEPALIAAKNALGTLNKASGHANLMHVLFLFQRLFLLSYLCVDHVSLMLTQYATISCLPKQNRAVRRRTGGRRRRWVVL